MRSFFLLLAALVLTTSCAVSRKSASAPAVTPPDFPNVLIADGKTVSLYGPCEPSIAINPVNPDNIAAGSILNNYHFSKDGGKTWESGVLKSTLGVFGDPVLLGGYDGNIYYAHLSDPEQMGWKSDSILDRIVIQKSADGGKTYNNGSYCGLRPPKDQDKQWLHMNPQNQEIYCTWTEFDVYGSKEKTDRSRILFSKSTDAAESWSPPVAINQFEGDCQDDDLTTEGAVPASGPNGEIYVAWAWDDKIWFDRSLDGGSTWLDEDKIVARQPGGWTFDIPGISRCNGMPVLVSDLSNGPNRGNLYVNWADQRNGVDDTDIWLAKSTDGGDSWSKPIRVNNDGKGKHQFLSWMAIDQSTGYLYIVFYDRRQYDDKQTDVYLAVSKDAGETFDNIRISQSPFTPVSYIFFGDYNHIAAHNGRIRPIWTRMDEGVLSIWTALIEQP